MCYIHYTITVNCIIITLCKYYYCKKRSNFYLLTAYMLKGITGFTQNCRKMHFVKHVLMILIYRPSNNKFIKEIIPKRRQICLFVL